MDIVDLCILLMMMRDVFFLSTSDASRHVFIKTLRLKETFCWRIDDFESLEIFLFQLSQFYWKRWFFISLNEALSYWFVKVL